MTGREIDAASYRKVLGRYPTGVTIVTAADSDGQSAMVIGSFVSVSLDPPLVGFLPAKSSASWGRIESTNSFCVNVLADDQVDVCNLFFRKQEDPWNILDWTAGETGSPIIRSALAWIDCTIHGIFDAGDHVMVLGRVVDSAYREDGNPLVFLGGSYGRFEAW